MVDPNTRLFFALAPRTDESLGGYVIRLAEANAGHSPERIMRSVFGECAQPQLDRSTQFAAYCRAEPDDIWGLSGFWRKQHGPIPECRLGPSWVIAKPHMSGPCKAICPRCLQDGGYSRDTWDISLYTCCVEHQCDLIDRCPECRRLLVWSRQSMTRCHCGFDMRHARETLATSGRLYISASLSDCVARTRLSPGAQTRATNRAYATISLVHPNTALQTLWFLAVSLPALIDEKICRGRAGVPLPTARIHADRGFHMLEDWPENFVTGLEQLFVSRLRETNCEAERILRFVRDRIYHITLECDPLCMRRIFQQQTRDLLRRAGRTGSLRSLSSQLEIEF
ncbi:TniQ family protein [Paraburkholderia sp. SIMBA_053]|uniref:TniQ family protein n=1 Tax=Paraburkholderia sp. SIMBA_053 TaxID=3085794 RepID=UPI00397BECFA